MSALGLVALLPALLALALAGYALDAGLGLALSPDPVARWALRITTAVAATYLLALHPAVLLLLVGAVLARRFTTTTSAARAPGPRPLAPHAPADRAVLAALALLVALAAIRPPVPLYWDEFVWLWKSRVELSAWGTLRAAALDPRADIYPPGYPLLWSLLPAWFDAPLHRTPLTVATLAPIALALALWLTALRAALRERAAWGVLAGAGLLAATPLALVHLRASYADLPVGLLASALALGEASARRDEANAWTSLPGRVAVAVVLVGLKDEGLVHLVALSATAAASALLARNKPAARDAMLVVLLGGAAPFLTWRVLLTAHGIRDSHHALAAFAPRELLPLARALLLHTADITTWGALWPLALAAALAAVLHRDPRARALAAALAAQTAALLLALACGTDRVREFAYNGTLLNRALIQLAPQAVAAVVAVGCARANHR